MQVEPKQNQLLPWRPAATRNGTISRAAASTSCDGMGPLYSPNGTCVHWRVHAHMSCYVHMLCLFM